MSMSSILTGQASIFRILQEAHSCGIFNSVNIISGFIGETWEDVRATEDLLTKNIEYIDGIRIFDFILVPGTPIYLSPGEYGIENIVESDEFNLNPGETGFDEVGGLRWNEKKRQNKEFYKYIRRVSDYMLKN